MTNHEINRSIAESLGMKAVCNNDDGLWSIEPNGKNRSGGLNEEHCWKVCCPNFTDSLDACRLFEEKLQTEKEKVIYLTQLARVQLRTGVARGTLAEVKDHLAFATPLQRCEAYLRMRGLWKEDK